MVLMAAPSGHDLPLRGQRCGDGTKRTDGNREGVLGVREPPSTPRPTLTSSRPGRRRRRAGPTPVFEVCSNEIPTAHVVAARRRCGRRARPGPPRARADRPTATTWLSVRCPQGGTRPFLENGSRGVQCGRARGNRSRLGGQATAVLRPLRRAPRGNQAEARTESARILQGRSIDLTETARAQARAVSRPRIAEPELAPGVADAAEQHEHEQDDQQDPYPSSHRRHLLVGQRSFTADSLSCVRSAQTFAQP